MMKTTFLNSIYIYALALAVGGAIFAPSQASADSGIQTKDLTQVTCEQIANSLVGAGISVSNITCSGGDVALGTFTGGNGIVGPDFDEGVILSSGANANVVGPNDADGTTTANGSAGDPDLDALVPGYETHDSAIVAFDFVPATDVVTFTYMFASEEFNEYSNTSFNDVFGFFIDGANYALLPDGATPVAINNVNGGHPQTCINLLDDDGDGLIDGEDPDCTAPGDNIVGEDHRNASFFINNDCSDPDGVSPCPIDIEADGLTVALDLIAPVKSGVVNHMKLGIADAGDSILDSWVFIKAGSIKSPNPTLKPLNATNEVGTTHTVTATLIDEYSKNPVQGETIRFEVFEGPNLGDAGTDITDENGEATFAYTGDGGIGTDKIRAFFDGQPPSESNVALKEWVRPSLDHFLSYKTRSTRGGLCAEDAPQNVGGQCVLEDDCGGTEEETDFCLPNKFPRGLQVSLMDRFDGGLYEVRKPLALLNPADKNDEGIFDEATHLLSYSINKPKGAPKYEGHTSVQVDNQFGQLFVDTLKPERLLVPAAMDENTPPAGPPDPNSHKVDHYTCYKVRISKGTDKFTPKLVTLVDQFAQPNSYEVTKPMRLCAPTDKNGEGTKFPDKYLMCYQIKSTKGEPKHKSVKGIYVRDQFGPGELDTLRDDALCVPSSAE